MKIYLSLLIAIFSAIFFISSAIAGSGCCSWHGGQSFCGASGYWICGDGTESPSCTCDYYPPTLEQYVQTHNLEYDRQQNFDNLMSLAKKYRDEASTCKDEKQTLGNSLSNAYTNLNEQKSTTFYIFLFAVCSVIVNIYYFNKK